MTIREAIDHWYGLAAQQEEMAQFYVEHGLPFGSVSAYGHRANTYRNAARALRLELETGEAWCACHLRPETEYLQRRGQ